MSFPPESTHDRASVAEQSALIEQLKEFEPFDRLAEEALIVVSSRAKVERSNKGCKLFELGDDDPWIFCLLDGSIDLVASDGRKHRVDAGTSQARRPVAQLKPRKYAAFTRSPSRFIRIDGTGFGDFSAPGDENSYFVAELDASAAEHQDRHFQSLVEGDLSLPSLPDVAVQTARLARREDVSLAEIARVITRDPVITARLIKAANSPIYYGKGAVETCERAVTRLGLDTTRQLVVAFSVRELFRAESQGLTRRMQRLWQHSAEVAASCFVLARTLGGFDRDEAQLAGLLHDIGVIPILTYAQGHPDLLSEPDRLDRLIRSLRGPIGRKLLESWNFSSRLVDVVAHSEDWWRDDGPDPDIVDLVIVGQLISFIGRDKPADVPSMSRLPAFKRLVGDRLDPQSVLNLVESAEEEMTQVKALLQG